ncbi:MAG: polysaccharide deacetylase family protein, partial [Steroidobacteraceae bacterium]
MSAITIDVHAGADPSDIESAGDWLSERGICATFFTVSCIFEEPGSAAAIRRLIAQGHEVASHCHNHDWREVRALIDGGERDLRFIRESKSRFEDCFGTSPVAFRSPRWCVVGRAAQDALVNCGYRVDSSATPQRPAILSSMPYERTWMRSPRHPYFLADGLLEIPTSCLLIPAGAPSVAILRSFSLL